MASNGVIHVIDGVLMPPADQPMAAEAPMEPETRPFRVAHSLRTPRRWTYSSTASGFQNLEFPTVTDWIELPAGTYSLAVAPAGAGIEAAAIGPADFDLPAGAYITVAAVGSLQNGTLKPQVLVEDYSEIAAGEPA